MGRTRRNCPVFGCGSTNLARLANHLDQVHGMDTEERKKWLKWRNLEYVYLDRMKNQRNSTWREVSPRS